MQSYEMGTSSELLMRAFRLEQSKAYSAREFENQLQTVVLS